MLSISTIQLGEALQRNNITLSFLLSRLVSYHTLAISALHCIVPSPHSAHVQLECTVIVVRLASSSHRPVFNHVRLICFEIDHQTDYQSYSVNLPSSGRGALNKDSASRDYYNTDREPADDIK